MVFKNANNSTLSTILPSLPNPFQYIPLVQQIPCTLHFPISSVAPVYMQKILGQRKQVSQRGLDRKTHDDKDAQVYRVARHFKVHWQKRELALIFQQRITLPQTSVLYELVKIRTEMNSYQTSEKAKHARITSSGIFYLYGMALYLSQFIFVSSSDLLNYIEK